MKSKSDFHAVNVTAYSLFSNSFSNYLGLYFLLIIPSNVNVTHLWFSNTEELKPSLTSKLHFPKYSS